MPVNRIRLSLLAACLAAVLSLMLSATASAAPITASQITSPSDPALLFEDENAGTGEVTVTGTVNGEGKVDLLCYYGSGEEEEAELIEAGVETEGGKFSETVEPSTFPENPCVLRAVPAGTKPAAPPGSSSNYEGPRVAASTWGITKDGTTKAPDDFDSRNLNLTSLLETTSAGDCGLASSTVFGSPTFSPPARLFECAGALFERLRPGNERSTIQVDGANAYDTFAGTKVFNATKPKTGSAPELTATRSFDAASALTTIKETEPLVGCSGSKAAFPETSESCEAMGSSGVSLEREWRPADSGQVMYMTDTWRSTDGKGHTVSAEYGQTFDAEEGGLLEVPGHTGFLSVKAGESLSVPSGGGVVAYREDAATPEAGDLVHPFGAIVYDVSPAEGLRVVEGSGFRTQFNMPYALAVPAGGAKTVRMAFVQSLTLPGARALAAEALAGFHPSISISSPTNGAALASASILVAGRASDALGLSSVNVNGTAATIGAGGAWIATVPLAVGANTLTATAVNVSGVSSSASIAVTRLAPPPPPPPPPAPRDTIKLGIVKVSKGQITFAITCKGPAGTSCNVQALLQTVERLSRGKVKAVLAAHTKQRTVTVGSYKATIAAGRHTIAVIKLNATGRKLLARFHKLPVKLTVTLIGTGGVRATALTQKLTVTPPRHKRRRH